VASEVELERRIKRIKAKVADLGDLRPGTLSAQYNTCGTPGCRCKDNPANRHGPYWQLSYSRGGRSRSESVRAEHLEQVRAEVATYQTLQALVAEWVDTAIDLDRLRRGVRSSPRRKA
jgi:hypothetical protein